MKPIVCKWCKAINKHQSAWCFKKPPTKRALKLKEKTERRIAVCTFCGGQGHIADRCYKKPRKLPKNGNPLSRPNRPIVVRRALPKQSQKEKDYQQWKETVARPFIIKRDGNMCSCCMRPAYEGEKLDIDHIKGKGSHPSLKRDLDNFQLLCRVCHQRKTDHLPCLHPTYKAGLIQ